MAEKRLILAHDLGTTGNKASLFDEHGLLLGNAFVGYGTDYPRPNWVEQHAADWWQAVIDTTQQLLAETDTPPDAIAAVGFSGQMMGCLPVDKRGEPLRPCIIWADTRAQNQAAAMVAKLGAKRIYQTVGHPASPAYSAAKILWIRDNQPEIYKKSACFLQPKDYVVFKLTGTFATDYSDASGTLLFDLKHRCWDSDFLETMTLTSTQLPALHASTDIIGEVTNSAAAATGLAVGTPVIIGGGDGSCAGVGAGVINQGDAYCNIGSSAWISVASEQPISDPKERTITFHHVHPQRYAPMGTMLAAGGARQWAWDLLTEPGIDLDDAVTVTKAGSDGLIFLPYLLGERSPYWNPLARGTYVGLSMSHTRPQMARAVLEGVSMHLGLILDALREQVSGIHAMRLIGGGSRSALWRQMLADVLGLPIQTLDLQAGATSWGAAVTAGVGVGLYDWSLADERIQFVDVADPTEDGMAYYHELTSIFADTYRALESIYPRLAKLS